ncbi:MAG: F0F1 ATP synthase subunit A [Mycoplasma sp.]
MHNMVQETTASDLIFGIRPQLFTIFLIMIILAIVYMTYFVKLRKVKPNQAPKGLVLVGQLYMAYMRNLTVDILGSELECLTPYFAHLFLYIGLSNIIGIVGFENPTSSLTITLSMGLVMFIGMFVIGFKYQKLSYLKKFTFNIKVKNKHIPIMINPNEVVSQFTPLISVSFRLWGNIFAGSVIGSLWYFFTGYISSQIPLFGTFNLIGGLTVPAINMYFDLLSGVIQALVFTLLTMIYWTLQKEGEHANHQEVIKIQPVVQANPMLDLA